MEKIIIPIKTDNKGKLTTISALKQIQGYTDKIIFPNIALEKTSLSMLTLENGKKCVKGCYVGKKYSYDKSIWNEGDLELIFE